MKVLITGASGFIGRNLVSGLPADWQVTAAYWRSDEFPAFVARVAQRQVDPVRVDLTSREAGTAITASGSCFDAGILLAANGDPARSVADPGMDLLSNTLSVIRLVETVRFKRLIYFSSGAVYDGIQGPVSPEVPVSPTLPYAISKLAAEQYLRHFQKSGRIDELFIVRFFGAYGPYEPERKIYGRLVRRFAFEKDPRFTVRGDGENLIDAMYVEDAVRAIRQLASANGAGGVVDCASGSPISLRALVEKAAEVFGLTAEITYTGEVPEYIQFHSVDNSMRTRYQFAPRIGLQEGLERFADFLRRR